MNFDYDQSTSKQISCHSPYDNRPAVPAHESEELKLTKEDLIKLLTYLEGELEAREDVIEKLKEERAKNLLHEAKYGRITAGDPFCAFRRDSDVTDERLDQEAIGELYESQLVHLEKLITVHKKSQGRFKNILAATEKRHERSLRQLELEKERKSAYAAQGDDVVAFLEREREKLQQQLDYQVTEVSNAKKETEKLERRLEHEKEKHKTMILFLINERKQMLVKMHELRVKGESAPPSSNPPIDAGLVEELKKELVFLRQERDQLKTTNKSVKAENLSLKEVLKGQEADLLLLRRNMLSNNKLPVEKHNPVEGSLVVANRMVSVNQPQRTTRLSNSSSFPSEKSRLPRAPSSPARTPSTPTRSLPSPRVPLSPTKKTPAMGIGMGTVRQRPPAPATVPKYNPEPELQQLEEAIQGLEQQANGGLLGSPTKRSNSLTRGKSEPRRVEQPQPVTLGGHYRTEPGRGCTPSAGLRPPSKVEKPVERKLSGTLRKNSLLKAFGGGK